MLILSRSKGVILSDVNKGKTHTIPDSKTNPSTWFERKYKNITAEYLTKTYGKVESKEHAEFIVKMAEGAGFTANKDYKHGHFFYISTAKYGFASEGFCKYGGTRLITIPLPPKDKSMESQKE